MVNKYPVARGDRVSGPTTSPKAVRRAVFYALAALLLTLMIGLTMALAGGRS